MRSTLNKPGTTDSCNMYFQYTLLADILHGSSELVLQELTFLGNLFSLLQEVLCSSLHWRRQNVCLLWATLLLIGWAFVAGVYQCGDLWQRLKKYIFTRDWLQGLKRVLEIKVMQIRGCYVTWTQEIGVLRYGPCCLWLFILHLFSPCTEMFKGMWTVVESQTISRSYIVQNSLHHFSMMRKYP